MTDLARVGVLARGALALSVAGGVIGVTAPLEHLTFQFYAGLAVIAAGVLLAAWCLRHGFRHDHERGRVVAAVAVVVGLSAASFMAAIPYFQARYPVVRRG